MKCEFFRDKLFRTLRGHLFISICCCITFLGIMQNTIFVQTDSLSAQTDSLSVPPAETSVPSAESSAAYYINWGVFIMQTLVAFVVGFVSSLFAAYFFHKRVTVPKIESRLKEETGLFKAELNNKKKMYELNKNPDGLELFESRLIEITMEAQKSIKLCLLTPLIHSLRKEWRRWDPSFPADHWASDFCKPFHDALSSHTNRVSVEIVFLQDDILESFIRQKITNQIRDWEGYKDAIFKFIEYLKFRDPNDHNGERIANVLSTQVPKIPFLLALVDVPTGDGEFLDSSHGLIAFINEREFHVQLRKNRTPDVIGKSLIPFEIHNRDILAMFSRGFDDLALHQDDKLFNFYKRCLAKSKNGEKYFWGLFTDAEDNIDTKNYTPHKMLLSETAIHGPEKEPGDQMLGE